MALSKENMVITVDNDIVKIQNKSDLEALQYMETEYGELIYSPDSSDEKQDFESLMDKIEQQTIQINYQRTSDLLTDLFKQLNLEIEVRPV